MAFAIDIINNEDGKGIRVKKAKNNQNTNPVNFTTTNCFKETAEINKIFENKFPTSKINKLIEMSRKRIPSISSDSNKSESEELQHKINIIKSSSKENFTIPNLNFSAVYNNNLLKIPEVEKCSVSRDENSEELKLNNSKRSQLEIDDIQRRLRKRVQSQTPDQGKDFNILLHFRLKAFTSFKDEVDDSKAKCKTKNYKKR